MSTLGERLNVAELGASILAGVVDHFDAAGATLPDRRYLAAGDPQSIAWDCEQLVVALSNIGWGSAVDVANPSPKPSAQISAMGVRHAVFSIQLVRCTPVSTKANDTVPPVEQIQAAGEQFMRDAGMLSQSLVTLVAELRQSLQPDPSGLVQPGIIDSLGPSGAYHGLEATLAITSLRLA